MPDVAAPAPAAAVDAVRDLLAALVASSTLSDAERARAVRRLRDDLAALMGQADLYLGDTDLAREASASGRQARLAEAYENAAVREQALKRGLATEDELDALGYFSRDDLDRMADDGTLWESLEEAAFGLGRLHGDALNAKVKRDHGKFSTMNVAGTGKVRGASRKAGVGSPAPPNATRAVARELAAPGTPTPKPGIPAKPAVAKPAVAKAVAKPAAPAGDAPGPDGVHDVGGDVNRAADLLARGQRVHLDQPNTASVLLGELARRVQEAKAAGDQAPSFDLCKVTVKGTNLFCAESKGVPRVKMPQLGGYPMHGSLADKLPKAEDGSVDLTREFRRKLLEQGVKTEIGTEKASHLRATQLEIDGGHVAKMVKALENGESLGDAPIFTSSDNYIVDGHHRWAANVGHDLADNKLGDVDMTVERVDMGIIELLDAANSFAHEMGIPQAAAGQAAVKAPEPTADERKQLDAGQLPERGELYFHTNPARLVSKYGPVNVADVPLDKVAPAKGGGIADAASMTKAAVNETGKSDPITLVAQPDGTYKVHGDGGSTYALASQAGWKSIPAMVVGSDEQAARVEHIAKQVKREEQIKAKRIEVDTAMSGMFTDAETAKQPQDFASLADMFTAAEADFPGFVEMLTGEGGLLGDIGGVNPASPKAATAHAAEHPDTAQVFFGPLKKMDRALQKINGKYDGDHNRLTDIIRGTVVVPTLGDMPTMLEALRKHADAHGWTVSAAENRYLEPPPPPPGAKGGTPLGYRDANISLRSPNGVAAELQFNTSAMLAAKGNEGHHLYEEQRVLEDNIKKRAKAAGGDGAQRPAGPTRSERKRLRELEDASRELYANALVSSYG